MHTDFATIIPCTGIYNIMLWAHTHGPLYHGRWQPMVAIKLLNKWEALYYLITFTWQICQDS